MFLVLSKNTCLIYHVNPNETVDLEYDFHYLKCDQILISKLLIAAIKHISLKQDYKFIS